MLSTTEQEKQKINKIESDLESVIEESKKEENKTETTEKLELVLTDLRKVKEGLASDINLKIFDEELREVGESWSEFSSTSDSRLLTLKNALVHANLTIALKYKTKTEEKKEVYWDDITETEEKEMGELACSWFNNIVDSINREVGDYDSAVERAKKSTSIQRVHYFIFYEDGSKEQWLALRPSFSDSDLSDGHTHGTAILEFAKPVSKFVDVYTCIGCGKGQDFVDLHSQYNSNDIDSLEELHKSLDNFDFWYNELFNAKEKDGNIITPSGKCLGSSSHTWEAATVQDSEGKTFDRAYGFIPNEGVIKWKLEISHQRIEENKKLAIDKIPNYINSLWEKDEFASYKDKSPCRQRMMYSSVQKCLNEKDHVLIFKYSGGEETLKINDMLAKVGDNFKELISTKKISYQSLERWIKQGLASSNIREEIAKFKNDNEFVTLKDKPQVLREIWGQQVERFIKERKAREFYSEQHHEKLTWTEAEMNIHWLYKEVLDSLGLNQKVSDIENELQAQVEVPLKTGQN